MKALVVFPITMHNYSFSAPACWLFSSNKDKVRGIYGFELTEELAQEYDFFIVELNWFIELYEFGLITEYIKKINPNSKILMGGLFAALKYEEIFKRYKVDYYIQGDNEEPINMILNDVAIREVPNVIGRDFINPITYTFKEEDFEHLDFNLDWFPSYFKYVSKTSSYYMEDENYERLYEYNNQYNLPMIITAKGGCSTRHAGCQNCMGCKTAELKKIYNRAPITMSNDVVIKLLHQLESKFERATLMILSGDHYDLSNEYFDLDMSVEIDSNMSIDQMVGILRAFPKCILNVGIYEEGVSGHNIRNDYKKLLDNEDENHKVQLFVYKEDVDIVDIPKERLLYSEDTFPKWAFWDYYQDFDMALRFSRLFYRKVGQGRRFEESKLKNLNK